MTEAKNPFEDLMKMGQDWTKTMAQGVEAFAPEGIEKLWPTMSKDMMEAFMGKGANPDGLDAKSKLLLTLQGLITMGGTAEPQMRLTIRHALEAGASAQEINETIAMSALFGGAPAMAKAQAMAAEIIAATDSGKEG